MFARTGDSLGASDFKQRSGLLPTLCEPVTLKALSEAIALIRGENQNLPIDVLRHRYKQHLVLTRESDDLLISSAVDLNYRLIHTTIPDNI